MDKDLEDMDEDLELIRKCLTLISRIAARGAGSPDPDYVRDTLMELAYALTRSDTDDLGSAERPSRPEALEKLHKELDYTDWTDDPFNAHSILHYAARTTWN